MMHVKVMATQDAYHVLDQVEEIFNKEMISYVEHIVRKSISCVCENLAYILGLVEF